MSSGGRSEYDALQVGLTRRWSRGFEFHAAYTLSRSMDYFSADPGSAITNTVGGPRVTQLGLRLTF